MTTKENSNWSAQLLVPLIDWLEGAYPEEGCGLILRDEKGKLRFRRCENVIDRYHELDPETYQRTARDFYMIDPLEFIKAEERNDEIAAIVHSHPDTGAYFSESDVEAALMPRDSEDDPVEPSHPGADYLVVSVHHGSAREARLYSFDERTGEFVAVENWDRQQLDEIVSDNEDSRETVA